MPAEKTPQEKSKPRIKAYTSTGSEKVKDPRDELLKKFSKNFRRVMENRENLLADKPIHPPKSVKFDPDIVETSIGGTQSLGRINQLSDTSISSYSSTSTTTGNSSTLSSDNSSSDSCTFNGSLSQSYIDTSSINGHNVNSSTDRRSVDQIAQRQRRSSTKGFITPSKLPRRLTGDGPLPSTPECFNPVSFETPKPKSAARRSASLEPRDDQDNSSVTVAVRVRPFTTRELATGEAKCVVSMVDNETIVTEKSGNTHHFVYDYSFWSFDKHGGSFANQEYVYNTLAQPMLGKAFEGYNVCLFAYGQTGSGKSYSIMGQGKDTGVIPRFCEDLFSRVEAETKDRVNVQISFFEIYNEKIHDLLQHDNKDKMGKKVNLKVREHPLLGPFVEGLSSHSVESFEDVETWLNLGNKHRATAATGMNDKSSRSHSVFTMVLTQTKVDTIEHEKHEHSITSKINLVDLAGSERQSQAKTSGDRLREGASINKSLLTLGKVISLLSESSINGKRKLFIPYRDSVLTWLLKESLGGNSKTAMLATIGPSNFHVDETLSTLRYAKQARSIINQAKVNEDPKAKLIRELRSEIEKLKSQSGIMGADPEIIVTSLAEISSLREQLLEKEREMQEMTKSWQERLKKSEERKVQEAKSLEKSGISFRVDNKRPSLVNLNEDPQLSEMLLYILKDGQTKIGQNKEGSTHDVKLCGPLIAVNHCILNYVNDIVSITPIRDALTYVNGNLITEPTVLHHGDRVILGGDHYFRFNHPIEASKPGRKSIGKGLKDFEFARKELLDVQNAKCIGDGKPMSGSEV